MYIECLLCAILNARDTAVKKIYLHEIYIPFSLLYAYRGLGGNDSKQSRQGKSLGTMAWLGD